MPDFRLEVYLGRWEFAARHHLTASDAETLTIGELLELAGGDAREGLLHTPLSYTPTWGTPELLEAISSTYDRVAPEHVLTFAGAEEAMFWALPELVGPGDHAIVDRAQLPVDGDADDRDRGGRRGAVAPSRGRLGA